MKLYNILTSILLTTLLLTIYQPIRAQDHNIQKTNLVYKEQNFKEEIRTLLCHKVGQQLSLPIINLNSNEQLLISFDDLNGGVCNYYFTIIHCNADWTASDLIFSEYLEGFSTEPITAFEFSFNTIQKYTHYSFYFPNQNIKPIISGNFIFQIEDELGQIVAHKRFMVLDNKINIKAKVKPGTLAEDRKTKHEIDFTIQHQNLMIPDPLNDIKVTIKQNNYIDNALTELKPVFIRNYELIYNYNNKNMFWGNNEFRHFDIKSLRYHSERIKEIKLENDTNYVYLLTDKKRTFKSYSIEPDINGKFIIKSQEGWKSEIEADYVMVYFSLNIKEFSYGNLYLVGGFSDWQIQEEFQLFFNPEKEIYENTVYLKQGYYNYLYAVKDTFTDHISLQFIEGTHYQTRNDYYIYVYCRTYEDRYDRFVGFLKTSSKELF